MFSHNFVILIFSEQKPSTILNEFKFSFNKALVAWTNANAPNEEVFQYYCWFFGHMYYDHDDIFPITVAYKISTSI